jgi:RNA polymerase sigma-70 factor, ECF subfamily
MAVTNASEQLKKFEEYLALYKDDVYRVALYFTKNKDDAEDLTQDAFIRAYTFFHRFRNDTNFKAWILKIMRNIYITQVKKKRPTAEHNDEQLFGYETNKNTENQVLDAMRTKEVQQAINKLPDEFREVIILCELEGHSYEEIARIIDIPVGTVRSRLHRGRMILKERLLHKT